MKTIGRILIILAVAALVGGAMVAIVNAQSGAAPVASERQTGADFRLQGAPLGETHGGFRPGDREGGAGGWAGMLGNVGIIAVLVVLVALPKKLLSRSAMPAKVRTG